MKLRHNRKANAMIAGIFLVIVPILVIIGFAVFANYNKQKAETTQTK